MPLSFIFMNIPVGVRSGGNPCLRADLRNTHPRIKEEYRQAISPLLFRIVIRAYYLPINRWQNSTNSSFFSMISSRISSSIFTDIAK